MINITLRDLMGEEGLRDRKYKCHHVYKNKDYPNCFLMFSDRERPSDSFSESFWELAATHQFYGEPKDLIKLFKQVIVDIEALS